tara:strand:+ start:26 stop:1012 length:987 start_codon:yes stop_codon:yes gene_type:complete
MIIKNYEPNKINLNKIKFILLYGENTGAKEDFTKIILKEKYDKLELYHENEVLNNLDAFYNSIASKSFFDNEKIIVIKKITNKFYNFAKELIDKDLKDLILILDADLLDNKSKLRNFFERDKKTICTAFYSDTQQTLRILANEQLKKNNINLSPQAINLIIDKSNGSRKHLRNELEKISSLRLTNKKIELDHIMKIVNLGNESSVSELTDYCLSKNKKKMIQILNENNFTDDDTVMILRILLNKVKRLLNLKKDFKKGNNIEQVISSYKPIIFWKDKGIVKEQINVWEQNKVKELISKISDIEYLVKKTPMQSKNILNNFLFEISAKS